MASIPKISLTRSQITLIGVGLAVVVIVFVLFIFGGSKGSSAPAFSLTVWGVDTEEAMGTILSGYKAARPNATIVYKQVAAEDYDESLLTALASGKGPDVFLIGNHDLFGRGALLSPAPSKQITTTQLQDLFPKAVTQDMVYGGNIYGLPLYMDTLALAYNKTMFDQAGIATPPQTWQDIIDLVPKLRTVDASGQLVRAAIALGGSEKSVDYSTDILNLLMLQNGTVMTDSAGLPWFDRGAGPAALRFYLQFADVGSPAYTWNDAQDKSLESFIAQRTAMTLLYQKDIATIKARSPFLDIGVIGVPQTSLDQAVNYPSYRSMAVWTGSKNKAWAWDFVIFATTNATAQTGYLAATGHPPALRSLIAKTDKNPDLALFGRATLTARSWQMGDYAKIKEIFSNAIQSVLSGAKSPEIAIKDAAAQAAQLVRK